uniref:DNA 3'-phosphatase n=1 Tax=viral metagenome TaxID=1070528 RepID=A0A6C0J8L7_9ZZZZ
MEFQCIDDNFYVGIFDTKLYKKIAAFSLNNTLINSSYDFLYSCVPTILQTLHKQKYSIFIFTNQNNFENFKNKFIIFNKSLNIPIRIFICIGNKKFCSIYKKPRSGMWDYFFDKTHINKNKSFYVGNLFNKKNTSDIAFSKNIGLKFYTPQEFFLKKSNDIRIELPFKPNIEDICKLSPGKKIPNVLILLGISGSGKTFFANKFLYEYDKIIDFDNLQQYIKTIKTKSPKFVIDSTNCCYLKDRIKITNLLKLNKIKFSCLFFDTTYEQSIHNYIFKNLYSKNNLIYTKNIPDKPSKFEGFDRIITIKFKIYENTNLYFNYLT